MSNDYFSANSLFFVHIFSLGLFSFLIFIIRAVCIGLGATSFTLSCLNESPLIKLMCTWDLFWYQSIK